MTDALATSSKTRDGGERSLDSRAPLEGSNARRREIV